MYLEFKDNGLGSSSDPGSGIEPTILCYGCEHICFLACTSCEGCQGTCSGIAK